MEIRVCTKRWIGLKKDLPSQNALSELSRQVALSFVDKYYQEGLYEGKYIDLLCEMATYFSDTNLNSIAASALFEIIVEKLCDDFEYFPLETYSRVMSQIISNCRKVPAGAALDRRLSQFGIHSFEQLYHRTNLLHTQKYSYHINKTSNRIILLSRVTIGADVAILSVMIQRLMRIFPEAEIVIIGSNKLTGVFGGNPRIRIRQLSYSRHGGLFERFISWHEALEIIAEEIPPDEEQNALLIDPDSRICQLGVLPLTHRDNYLFFNSRDRITSPKNACMAELTNHWMDSVFGISDFCYPTVWIPPSILTKAGKKTDSLRSSGCKSIIAINFGVGENPRKRVGVEFERNLLREILRNPHSIIILDKGFGQDETLRCAQLATAIRNEGFKTIDISFGNSAPLNLSHGLVTVQCDIGEMAALITESDEFIGYDSACQHIAAATGTATVTVFAGTNNINFIHRWAACGNCRRKIVHVNTLTDPQNIDVDEAVLRVIQERASIAITEQQTKYNHIVSVRSVINLDKEPVKK